MTIHLLCLFGGLFGGVFLGSFGLYKHAQAEYWRGWYESTSLRSQCEQLERIARL